MHKPNVHENVCDKPLKYCKNTNIDELLFILVILFGFIRNFHHRKCKKVKYLESVCLSDVFCDSQYCYTVYPISEPVILVSNLETRSLEMLPSILKELKSCSQLEYLLLLTNCFDPLIIKHRFSEAL